MVKNAVKKLFPDYAVKAVQEARARRAKNALLKNSAERATAIVLQQQDILLELGAGDRKGANGWTTLDICANCDIYWDLRLPLPFPANSITKIYSSHVLEHFDYPDLMKLLAECHRILKPHGMFSVCVPDASIYIKGYVSVEEFTPQNVYEPRPSKNGQTGSTFLPRMWTSSPHSRSGLGPHSLSWCIAT
jgi:SAM-dependent methyltransferase